MLLLGPKVIALSGFHCIKLFLSGTLTTITLPCQFWELYLHNTFNLKPQVFYLLVKPSFVAKVVEIENMMTPPEVDVGVAILLLPRCPRTKIIPFLVRYTHTQIFIMMYFVVFALNC